MSDQIPPYVSFRTFENFLTELRARGIPARVDRSVLPHKSGTIQSQLLLALTYLDLVTEAGRPTDRLRSIVESEGEERRRLLRETLKSSYNFLFKGNFDLKSATSNQTEELFQGTGASGETVRRCISFFLAAARSCGLKVSPYIKPHRGKKAAPRSSEPVLSPAVPRPSLPREEEAAVSKEISLKSGGTLKLEISVNLFDLQNRDREFVFDLIDRLNAYTENSDGQRP